MERIQLYKGMSDGLDKIKKVRGRIYFVENTGEVFFDVTSDMPATETTEAVDGTRVQVNAKAARYLINSSGEYVDIDNILVGDTEISVSIGGTGRSELPANSVLIGNGTDPIKATLIQDGFLVVGDSTNGIKGISGSGILTFGTDEQGNLRPVFIDRLPPEMGGTGVDNIDEVLDNTKTEINTLSTSINNLRTAINNINVQLDNFYKKGAPNTYLYYDANGNLTTKSMTVVNQFNGRTGNVTPQAGDYTAAMVGARPNNWMPTAKEVGAATEQYVNQSIQQAIQDTWAASY